MNDGLGKQAELKIKEWLDKPELGYSIDRLPDQMTGWYGSKNICDFICFKAPYMYYIESKATWEDRFNFSMITDYQFEQLLNKSKIYNVYGLVIVLFATYKRAFIFKIEDIKEAIDNGIKSVNIKKIDKWVVPNIEVYTIPNNRKKLLDYTGNIEEYIGNEEFELCD